MKIIYVRKHKFYIILINKNNISTFCRYIHFLTNNNIILIKNNIQQQRVIPFHKYYYNCIFSHNTYIHIYGIYYLRMLIF